MVVLVKTRDFAGDTKPGIQPGMPGMPGSSRHDRPVGRVAKEDSWGKDDGWGGKDDNWGQQVQNNNGHSNNFGRILHCYTVT